MPGTYLLLSDSLCHVILRSTQRIPIISFILKISMQAQEGWKSMPQVTHLGIDRTKMSSTHDISKKHSHRFCPIHVAPQWPFPQKITKMEAALPSYVGVPDSTPWQFNKPLWASVTASQWYWLCRVLMRVKWDNDWEELGTLKSHCDSIHWMAGSLHYLGKYTRRVDTIKSGHLKTKHVQISYLGHIMIPSPWAVALPTNWCHGHTEHLLPLMLHHQSPASPYTPGCALTHSSSPFI